RPGTGGRAEHPTAVPAVLFAQPELNRTALGIRQTTQRVRKVPRELRLVPRGDRKHPGQNPNDSRPTARILDDPEIPGVQRCLTAGRVGYSFPRCVLSTVVGA